MEGQTEATLVYEDYGNRALPKGVANDTARFCTVAYNDRFTSSPNCASIVESASFVDAVEPYFTAGTVFGDTTKVSTCDNVPYMFGGVALTEAGLYPSLLKTANDMDSFIFLDLMVYPTYKLGLDTTEYMVSDTAFASEGSKMFAVNEEKYLSCKGCDSIMTAYMAFVYDANSYTDTIKVNINDTTFISINDTTFVNVNDTTYTNIDVYDTTYVSVTDTLVFELTAGIDDANVESVAVKVFPNPASNMLNVSFADISVLTNVSLKLYDMKGQMVAEKTVAQALCSMDISSLGAGSYLLNIVKEGSVLDHKVIVIQ